MEIWKQIENYEGYYEVSNLGRVRSVERYTNDGKHLKGRILKNVNDHKGYYRVGLSKNGKQKGRFVHDLMLRAFVGPPPTTKHFVCHSDDIGTNNTLQNMYWGTQIENAQDKIRNGRDPGLNRTHCPQGHSLDWPNVRSDVKGRGCLSCFRAKSRVKCSDLPFKEIADQEFTRIMEAGDPLYRTIKTHCNLGHSLDLPNQVPGKTRSCFACHKAHGYKKADKWKNVEFKEIADFAYSKIMQDVVE